MRHRYRLRKRWISVLTAGETWLVSTNLSGPCQSSTDWPKRASRMLWVISYRYSPQKAPIFTDLLTNNFDLPPQEMEKWLKMPNFKFIQCQQIFVMRLTQGARKLRWSTYLHCQEHRQSNLFCGCCTCSGFQTRNCRRSNNKCIFWADTQMANGEEVCSITVKACVRVRGGVIRASGRWLGRPAGRG